MPSKPKPKDPNQQAFSFGDEEVRKDLPVAPPAPPAPPPVMVVPKSEPLWKLSDNGQKVVTKEWVNWYLNVPNWVCSCGITMFGRAKKCICGQPKGGDM